MSAMSRGLQSIGGIGACFLLAAAGLTGIVYFAVVRPSHQTWKQQLEVANQATQQAGQVKALESQVSDAGSVLADINSRLEQQQIDLGDATQLNQRIASLIDLARETGLDVAQLQPGGEHTTEHYRLLSMQLEAVASPDAHAAFLEKLHTRFPDMSVMSLDLTHGPGRGEARPRGVFRMAWFTAIEAAPAKLDAALTAAESS